MTSALPSLVTLVMCFFAVSWPMQQQNSGVVSKPRKAKLKRVIFKEVEDPLPTAKRRRTDSLEEEEPLVAAPVSYLCFISAYKMIPAKIKTFCVLFLCRLRQRR